MSIYKKLLEIQKKVNGFKKNAKSFGYEYVSGTKVLEHIKPLMNEYGLILKQEITSIENTRQDYLSAKGAQKNEILSKVMMRFTWIDCETGESDVNEFGANGQNDWEKGLGSALTYAERYFLLKFFHIATDEDDIDNDSRKPTDKNITPTQPTIDIEGAKAKLIVVKTLNELKQVYTSLSKLEQSNTEVIALKDKLKATLK